MTTRLLLGIGVLIAAIAGAAFYLANTKTSDDAQLFDPVAVEAGRALYAENCAACHGVNLEGQPDWRSQNEDGTMPAPPHDSSGHTWHHSDSALFDYTKLGGAVVMEQLGIEFESGMPSFEGILTDEDINNILTFIKSTWPEKERVVQAERTKSEQQ